MINTKETAVPKKKLKLKNWVKYLGFFVMGIIMTIIIVNLTKDKPTDNSCYQENYYYYFEMKGYHYE